MLKNSMGFEGCLQVDCVEKSGGLLLLWKEDWKVLVLSFLTSHIDARISWVAADKVCLLKGLGGLSFKGLVLFNQALLTKQAWHPLENPSSLTF